MADYLCLTSPTIILVYFTLGMQYICDIELLPYKGVHHNYATFRAGVL